MLSILKKTPQQMTRPETSPNSFRINVNGFEEAALPLESSKTLVGSLPTCDMNQTETIGPDTKSFFSGFNSSGVIRPFVTPSLDVDRQENFYACTQEMIMHKTEMRTMEIPSKPSIEPDFSGQERTNAEGYENKQEDTTKEKLCINPENVKLIEIKEKVREGDVAIQTGSLGVESIAEKIVSTDSVKDIDNTKVTILPREAYMNTEADIIPTAISENEAGHLTPHQIMLIEGRTAKAKSMPTDSLLQSEEIMAKSASIDRVKYLKIRNLIISKWITSPLTFLTKTECFQLSRSSYYPVSMIHNFLSKQGIINSGVFMDDFRVKSGRDKYMTRKDQMIVNKVAGLDTSFKASHFDLNDHLKSIQGLVDFRLKSTEEIKRAYVCTSKDCYTCRKNHINTSKNQQPHAEGYAANCQLKMHPLQTVFEELKSNKSRTPKEDEQFCMLQLDPEIHNSQRSEIGTSASKRKRYQPQKSFKKQASREVAV